MKLDNKILGNASRYLFISCVMYLHEAEMQNEDVTIFSKVDTTQKNVVSYSEFVERNLRLSGERSLPVTYTPAPPVPVFWAGVFSVWIFL